MLDQVGVRWTPEAVDNNVIGFKHDDVRTRFRVSGLRPSREGIGPVSDGIIAPTVAVRLNGFETHGWDFKH